VVQQLRGPGVAAPFKSKTQRFVDPEPSSFVRGNPDTPALNTTGPAMGPLPMPTSFAETLVDPFARTGERRKVRALKMGQRFAQPTRNWKQHNRLEAAKATPQKRTNKPQAGARRSPFGSRPTPHKRAARAEEKQPSTAADAGPPLLDNKRKKDEGGSPGSPVVLAPLKKAPRKTKVETRAARIERLIAGPVQKLFAPTAATSKPLQGSKKAQQEAQDELPPAPWDSLLQRCREEWADGESAASNSAAANDDG
jgi:hypothetical protein